NAGHDVNVQATNDLKMYDVIYTSDKASTVSLGAGVSYNTISNTTEAYIGNGPGSSVLPAGQVTAGHDVNVNAESDQRLVAVGLTRVQNAAQQPSNTSGSPASGGNTDASANASSQNPQASKNASSFGIGVSGNIAFNHLSDSVTASLRDNAHVT